MTLISDFLDVDSFLQVNPDYKAISRSELDKLEVGMEVRVQHNGEYLRIRIDEIDGNNLTGTVVTKLFYQHHSFVYLDQISFEKKNIIDIYDINRWGVKL